MLCWYFEEKSCRLPGKTTACCSFTWQKIGFFGCFGVPEVWLTYKEQLKIMKSPSQDSSLLGASIKFSHFTSKFSTQSHLWICCLYFHVTTTKNIKMLLIILVKTHPLVNEYTCIYLNESLLHLLGKILLVIDPLGYYLGFSLIAASNALPSLLVITISSLRCWIKNTKRSSVDVHQERNAYRDGFDYQQPRRKIIVFKWAVGLHVYANGMLWPEGSEEFSFNEIIDFFKKIYQRK